MITRHFSGNKSFNLTIPDNEIWYTSSDGNIVTPYDTNVFGANIVSNTYENGKGIIKFDNSVTSIGICAFLDCSYLTSIAIPNSVTSIGYGAFGYCFALTSITYNGTMEEWNAIQKDSSGASWNYGVPTTVVHCTDGDAAAPYIGEK